jgi:hypothetical protein
MAGFGNKHCSFADLLSKRWRKDSGGRLFHYFLVPPLDAAFPLETMQNIPMVIRHDLHFYMARRPDVFFNKY